MEGEAWNLGIGRQQETTWQRAPVPAGAPVADLFWGKPNSRVTSRHLAVGKPPVLDFRMSRQSDTV